MKPPGESFQAPAAYVAAAEMTGELVRRARTTGPRFRLPPRKIALAASLADVGERLALNAAARELLAELEAEAIRRKLEDGPTVMMLRAALELNGIPVRFVPLAELGLPIPPGQN
jgi:hypothetical protein